MCVTPVILRYLPYKALTFMPAPPIHTCTWGVWSRRAHIGNGPGREGNIRGGEHIAPHSSIEPEVVFSQPVPPQWWCLASSFQSKARGPCHHGCFDSSTRLP